MIGHQALVYCLNGVIDVREYNWLHSTSNPAAFGSKKPLSSKHLTWIFLWGLIIHHMKDRWLLGPLRGTLLFLAIPAFCISPATWDSIKVDAFLFVFQILWWLPGLAGTDWRRVEKPLDVCGKEAVKKTSRSSFYLRGHPQIPVGDVPTELPTKLDRGEKEKKKEQRKKK